MPWIEIGCILVVGGIIACYLVMQPYLHVARGRPQPKIDAPLMPAAIVTPAANAPEVSAGGRTNDWWPVQTQALLNAFNENPASARARYDGRLLEVSGTICGINNELDFVTLNGSEPTPFRKVQCRFTADLPAGMLSIGQDVSIRGRCKGLIMNVVLEECVLAGR